MGRRTARGMTLVELLVVVAIVGILVGIAFWNLTDVVPGWRLRTASSDVATRLALVRARAISKNRQYIVEFQASGYRVIWDRTTLGSINVGAGADTVEETHAYGTRVEYYRPTTDPLPGGDFVVVAPRGTMPNIGVSGQMIGLKNAAGRTREVEVFYSGLVRKR